MTSLGETRNVWSKKVYVCGFLFWYDSVLLVRKTHPAWQNGLMNGVGGVVEHGEEIASAMSREFGEETALPDAVHAGWNLFCHENHPEYVVYFFRARCGMNASRPKTRSVNDVGERLSWEPVRLETFPPDTLVGNLRWLIPMALDWRQSLVASVNVKDSIRENPSW